MSVARYRHPLRFYGLSIAIPWSFWFAAAYASHLTPTNTALAAVVGIFGFVGLLAPAVIAFWMIWPEPQLRDDLKRRLFTVRAVRPLHLFLTCFLMLGSILCAQAISLFFGYSTEQFALSSRTSFSAGIVPAWFLLLLAPLVEELAWHSYGTDCLRQRMNLLNTSIVFAVFWALWHLPLSFIKDYYHSNVAETGLLYSINFAISIFPFVILMNWLYYKTGRNVLVAIVFHITANVFNELFATHPDSKVIQTALLLVLCAVLIFKDREFFLRREYADSYERGSK